MIESRRCRPALGTYVDIRARGSASAVGPAVEAAFRAVDRVQRKLSFFDPCSDVSRLNRGARRRAVAVAPETASVLRAARTFAEASGGLFDVTVAGPLARGGALPRPRRGPVPRRLGAAAIRFLPGRRIRFDADVWIDLGGIAKGFAVDRACAALEKSGVRDYVVNAGGDLRVGQTRRPVWIRHPALDGRWVALGSLKGRAAATSADGFTRRRVKRRWWNVLIDPRSGRAAVPRRSVTVIAPDAMTADALTKVAALGGPARFSALARRFKARVVVVPEGPGGRGR